MSPSGSAGSTPTRNYKTTSTLITPPSKTTANTWPQNSRKPSKDFREAYRTEAEPVSWAGLAEPLSYAEGFAHTVPNITDRNNSIIALYNYTYPGTVHGTENVLFVGNYTY